jgi:hypothetical protein
VLNISWVAVVGVLWGDGRTPFVPIFGGLLTPKMKIYRFPDTWQVKKTHKCTGMSAQRRRRDEVAAAAAGDTLARPRNGAVDRAGSPGATFRARPR